MNRQMPTYMRKICIVGVVFVLVQMLVVMQIDSSLAVTPRNNAQLTVMQIEQIKDCSVLLNHKMLFVVYAQNTGLDGIVPCVLLNADYCYGTIFFNASNQRINNLLYKYFIKEYSYSNTLKLFGLLLNCSKARSYITNINIKETTGPPLGRNIVIKDFFKPNC